MQTTNHNLSENKKLTTMHAFYKHQQIIIYIYIYLMTL